MLQRMKPSTESDYHRRIARVIEAILVAPGAPHCLESLASVAHLSPFHFHRIYRALTGERVAETIQRLRLAEAAHRLRDGGASVTTIALDVGYDSPPAFSRAFRGFAGISPSAFRTRQSDLATKVEIIELPPRDALCLRHEGTVATIGQTYRKLFRTLGFDYAPAGAMIGICSGDPEAGDGFRYLAGIVPTHPVDPVGAVEAMRVEGGLYAAYRLAGPWTLIAPTFQTLYGGWLPQSGYDPDDRPALELYRTPSMPNAPDECVTDLLIPIRRT
jgi:AraC family transcriptional regulator